MRILATNDDGVRAPGLAVLARALADAGHDVYVVAPASEASGAGAGVGPLHAMGGGIAVETLELPALDGIVTIAADALPALIVITACLGAYGPPPDLVVAGINPGRNVGRAVLHSGTIGAALTSVHFAKRGLAVSIQSGPVSSFESAGETELHYASAAALAVVLAEQLADAPECTVLNLNVPNLPLEEIAGFRRAAIATTGLVQAAVSPGGSDGAAAPTVQLELGYRAAAAPAEAGAVPEATATDETLSTSGFAVVTALASVAEDLRPEVSALVDGCLSAAGERLGVPV